MPVYPVTQNQSLISGKYSDPYVVRNADTVNNVYLGQDSSLQVGTHSITLTPGSTLNWGADTELWAVTDKGKTANIELLFTGNSAFTPGPSTVSLQTQPDILTVLPSVVTLPNTPIILPLLDVSDYTALYIDVQPATIVSGFPDLSALVDVQAAWSYITSLGIPAPVTLDEFYGSPYSDASTLLTVKAPGLLLQLTNLGSSAVTYQVTVIGYKQQGLAEYYRNNWLSDTVDSGYTAITGTTRNSLLFQVIASITRTTAGISSAFSVFDHYSGPARVPFARLNPTAGAPTMSLNVSSGAPGSLVFFNRSASVLQDTTDLDIYLPRMPVYLRFTSGFTANPSTGAMSFLVELEGINKEH